MNILFAIMSGIFCFISTIFLSLLLHEYIHVWQLRPNRPEEIVILGYKNNEWGGWVTGKFGLTGKSERRQELEASTIEFICISTILIPYILMLLRELGM